MIEATHKLSPVSMLYIRLQYLNDFIVLLWYYDLCDELVYVEHARADGYVCATRTWAS
jgi:hypothetical protein